MFCSSDVTEIGGSSKDEQLVRIYIVLSSKMFLPQEFVQKDSKEIVSLFPSLKKDKLLELAKHFKKPATTQWRKAEIRKVVLTTLVKGYILSDEEAQELCVFEMTSDQI